MVDRDKIQERVTLSFEEREKADLDNAGFDLKVDEVSIGDSSVIDLVLTIKNNDTVPLYIHKDSADVEVECSNIDIDSSPSISAVRDIEIVEYDGKMERFLVLEPGEEFDMDLLLFNNEIENFLLEKEGVENEILKEVDFTVYCHFSHKDFDTTIEMSREEIIERIEDFIGVSDYENYLVMKKL